MAQLKNKTIIEGKIRLLSGLHIGSGQMSMETDASVMKDAFDKPYIPGSSLKGVLRTVSERLHQLVLGDDEIPVCYLAEKDCNQKTALKEELQPLVRNGQEEEVNQKIDEAICPVCQLYGSVFRASKLIVNDAYLINGNEDELTAVRHSVRIDRDTGAAKDGAKYDYEVVNAGELFSFKLEAENLTVQDEKLLYLAIHEFMNGKIQLGGKVSRGLGAVELTDIQLQTFDFSSPEDKAAYLKSLFAGTSKSNKDIQEQFNLIFELA